MSYKFEFAKLLMLHHLQALMMIWLIGTCLTKKRMVCDSICLCRILKGLELNKIDNMLSLTKAKTK